MRKTINGFKIIVFIVLVAAVLIGTLSYTANKTYQERKANEKLTTVDTYAMNNYCKENADAVMCALKKGDKSALEKMMIDPKGIDDVINFADWTEADFDDAVSMGSGSLTKAPNNKDQQDVSERFFVKAGGTKYVFFIETRTSKLGRDNDGVSAIGVTTFSHFDATGYAWNGEKDGSSALAGKLFWDK